MILRLFLAGSLAAAVIAAPVAARTTFVDGLRETSGSGRNLPYHLECVPYARAVSGINIFGDAHSWWKQAEGRYSRGYAPKVGAVMAFRPHGGSRLGHVAAVSRILDSRTVLIRHSNWSPINGRRGQIEDNVRVIDVSPGNDWSVVRVWYAPLQALGGTHWPIQGFIYPGKPKKAESLKNRPIPANLPRGSDDPIGEIIGQKMGW